MVLTIINLKLIKCDFLLDLIFFSFKKKKKKETSFPLGHLICSFEKNLEIGKIQKMQERHYLQQQLESHFWPGKR